MTFPALADKDPNSIIDYVIDWTDWLQGDTISTSAWTVPSGITKQSDTNTDSTTTIWLSSGTAGDTYVLSNRIVTVGARTEDRSFTISAAEK